MTRKNIVIGVLVIILVVIAGICAYKYEHKPLIYKSDIFSVSYPKGWSASNSITFKGSVTFNDPSGNTPYEIDCASTTDVMNLDNLLVKDIKMIEVLKLQATQPAKVIIDGVTAAKMSFTSADGALKYTKISFANNHYTCTIQGRGATYYQSPEFTAFYTSFKFVK
jgi:hypothetical protein